MGSTWVLSAPDGPHVGPTNFVIWEPQRTLDLFVLWKSQLIVMEMFGTWLLSIYIISSLATFHLTAHESMSAGRRIFHCIKTIGKLQTITKRVSLNEILMRMRIIPRQYVIGYHQCKTRTCLNVALKNMRQAISQTKADLVLCKHWLS